MKITDGNRTVEAHYIVNEQDMAQEIIAYDGRYQSDDGVYWVEDCIDTIIYDLEAIAKDDDAYITVNDLTRWAGEEAVYATPLDMGKQDFDLTVDNFIASSNANDDADPLQRVNYFTDTITNRGEWIAYAKDSHCLYEIFYNLNEDDCRLEYIGTI